MYHYYSTIVAIKLLKIFPCRNNVCIKYTETPYKLRIPMGFGEQGKRGMIPEGTRERNPVGTREKPNVNGGGRW